MIKALNFDKMNRNVPPFRFIDLVNFNENKAQKIKLTFQCEIALKQFLAQTL